jgi:hypothetical protein
VNILPPAENINANVGPLPTLVKKLAPTDTIKAALMPSPTWVRTLPTPNRDGFSAALMIGGGTANIFTKVGNGITLAAMVGSANIFTHIGNGFSVAFETLRFEKVRGK